MLLDIATSLFIKLVTKELLDEAEKDGTVRFDDYNLYAKFVNHIINRYTLSQKEKRYGFINDVYNNVMMIFR